VSLEALLYIPPLARNPYGFIHALALPLHTFHILAKNTLRPCRIQAIYYILTNMKLFNQTATLLLAFIFVLIVVNTQLSSYITPILGVIIIFSVIFIIIMRRAKKGDDLLVGSNKEVFTVVTAVMLAIFLTGGLTSNLYFLLYFLIFGIIFLFEPLAVFIMVIGMLVVFYGEISQGDFVSNLIKLGSLVLFAPIAYFFGREFQKREDTENEVEDKTGQIIEDARAVQKKDPNMSEDSIDEVEDIIEKANELRQKVQEDN